MNLLDADVAIALRNAPILAPLEPGGARVTLPYLTTDQCRRLFEPEIADINAIARKFAEARHAQVAAIDRGELCPRCSRVDHIERHELTATFQCGRCGEAWLDLRGAQ